MNPLYMIPIIAVLVVMVILALGINTFGKEGAANRHRSNMLMRYRIAAQAVAVLIIVAVAAYARHGGQ